MESRVRFSLIVPLLLLGNTLANAPEATASVFTTGCANQSSCTLQELFAGGVITAGGTRFSSWEIEVDPGGVDFSQVVIVGLGDGGIDPGPGLQIQANGQLQVNGPGELDLRIGFRAASIYPNFRIRDNRLEVTTSSTTGTGRVAVDENVFDNAFRFLAWKDARIDPAFGDVRTMDSAQFDNQTSLYIEKDFLLDGRGINDSATLDEVSQRFSQTTVPEPSLGVSLLLASILLSTLGRRVRPSTRIESIPEDAP